MGCVQVPVCVFDVSCQISHEDLTRNVIQFAQVGGPLEPILNRDRDALIELELPAFLFEIGNACARIVCLDCRFQYRDRLRQRSH
mgnify:CR=1 FL=1